MQIQVLGWGTAVPPNYATQEQAANSANHLWANHANLGSAVTALYRRSGVKTRHSVVLHEQSDNCIAQQNFFPPATDLLDRGPTTEERMKFYEASATQLGAAAAFDALHNANCQPEGINHLVTVSCSGFSAPGLDIGLMNSLGLGNHVSRTHVGFMGCHGALNGLRVAAALARSFPRDKILVCCAELCTLHQQYTNQPQGLVANSLFADGAAAVVVNAANRDEEWELVDQHSELLPGTEHFMSWRIGNNGFEMTLRPEVPSIIASRIGKSIEAWLSRHDLNIGDIRSWAIHPGGPRILNATAQGLGIAEDHLRFSREILARYGNMSSPTVLFILKQLRSASAAVPCVALAFGPGLTIEAALFNKHSVQQGTC